ncbi:putative uncharacterized protein [Bacteroides pectinophilus CAG:437]|uniref:Peptidase M6-like domain-containing protein n=1 Tax=Bacteroides pectinophilus CAG:437 TaxID=1263051 RepID=R7AC27_9FIRM|nr:putative uncharacterized protein [Bacteroides pectinophilus CAG:437]
MLNDRFMSIRQINMREELRMKKKTYGKTRIKSCSFIKKVTGMVAAVSLAVGMIVLPDNISGTIRKVDAAQPVVKAANVVVVVKFAGDTSDYSVSGYNKAYTSAIEGAPRTYWEYFQRTFNGQNDKFWKGSFKEYFYDISGGRHQVDSVFPQTNDDGTVTYIEMDNTVDNYKGATGEALMIDEIARKLNEAYPSYDGAQLDLNNDGIIDNFMIIPSVTSQNQFTPHSSTGGNTSSFAGRKIGAYNVIENRTSSALPTGMFDIHTAAHEYIHTFGIPDYYRSSYQYAGSGENPVGIWDPMGVPGQRPWPLAVTREAIGWTTVNEKPAADNSYVLYDAAAAYNDADKVQALKFYTPMSASEYFVVEYRKEGSQSDNKSLDRGAPGDGLIVYRVNPSLKDEGNLQGKDYIYVFRPGDTSITASDGIVENAQVGLASYKATRQEIGSLDMNKKITDDAICYSDGRNSGIKINVTAQTDDSVSFNIQFADYSALKLWSPVTDRDGTSPFSSITASAAKAVADGNDIYILAEDIRSANILKYDGSDWKNLGECASGSSGIKTSIAAYDGTSYVLIADYSSGQGRTILKKYNNGVWQQVDVIEGYTANAPALGVAGGSLYALIDNNGKSAKLYKLIDGRLTETGEAIDVNSINSPEIFDYNGVPAVAYGNFSFSNGSANAAVLENGKWHNIMSDTSAYSVSNAVAVSDGVTYILNTYNSGDKIAKLRVIDANGSTDTYKLNGISQGASSGSISVDSGYVYISVVEDGNAITYTASADDLSKFTKLGGTTYSPAGGVSTVISNRVVYSAVVPEVRGTMDVRSYKALDKQDTTKPQPTTTAQAATKPQPTTTAQAATKPQPTTTAQATTKPQPTTTAQTASDTTGNSDDNNGADDSAKADNAAASTAASGSLNVSGINATVSVKNGTVIKNAAGIAVNSGNVYLRAIPKTAGQSEADRIRQAVANQNMDLGNMQFVYYEVELVDAAGNPLTFDGNITVTFAYPEGTDAQTYTFKVLHLLKSGVLDVMDPYVISDGLSVEVSELSPFAIAYKEAASEVVQTGENVSSTQTGDRTPVVILMALIAVSAAVLLGITYSSKNRKSER